MDNNVVQNAGNNLNAFELLRQLLLRNISSEPKIFTIMDYFKTIESRDLSTKENSLFIKIHN